MGAAMMGAWGVVLMEMAMETVMGVDVEGILIAAKGARVTGHRLEVGGGFIDIDIITSPFRCPGYWSIRPVRRVNNNIDLY
jgi:hypothetical protein